MVVVPTDIPLTTPVDEPMDAIEASLLLHVPEVVEFVSVVLEPTHTLAVPPIDAGTGFTLTVAVLADVQVPFVAVTV